jgi:hypothetical protein
VERRFYQNPQKHVNTIFSDFFTADFRCAAAPAGFWRFVGRKIFAGCDEILQEETKIRRF